MAPMDERVTKSQNVVFIVGIALLVQLWIKFKIQRYGLDERIQTSSRMVTSIML